MTQAPAIPIVVRGTLPCAIIPCKYLSGKPSTGSFLVLAVLLVVVGPIVLFCLVIGARRRVGDLEAAVERLKPAARSGRPRIYRVRTEPARTGASRRAANGQRRRRREHDDPRGPFGAPSDRHSVGRIATRCDHPRRDGLATRAADAGRDRPAELGLCLPVASGTGNRLLNDCCIGLHHGLDDRPAATDAGGRFGIDAADTGANVELFDSGDVFRESG